MGKYRVEDIRNVALAGHGAAGKTSLADALLHLTGASDRRGSVDEGTSVSDYDDEERQRKYSIDVSVMHLEHEGKRINLIDTPGYPDFIGGALAALKAVETVVVVVNARAGVQVNTRRLFEEAGRQKLGRMLVLNQLDSENVNFGELLGVIHETLSPKCTLLNVPVGLGADFKGVVSVLALPGEVPAGAVVDAQEAHQALLDAVVESDEALMERYLEGEELSAEEIKGSMVKAIAAGSLIPILCTSVKKDIGLREVLAAIGDFALSPLQGAPRVASRTQKGQEEKAAVEAAIEKPFVAQVFKTMTDPFVGKLSFFRVYSGKLPTNTTVNNSRTGNTSRTGQLFQVQGKQQTPIDEAVAGDLVAVAKVEDLSLDDTLTRDGDRLTLPRSDYPRPMFGLAVQPKSRGDEQKISGSLTKIADEDPTFKVTRDSQTHELVINGMSQLHLDVVRSRLKRRFDLEVETKQPKVAYRETVVGKGDAEYQHRKQTGGRGQYAKVHLRVAPVPREWASLSEEEAKAKATEFAESDQFPEMKKCSYDHGMNFLFVNSITGASIPPQYHPAVDKGVREALEKGVLAGCQVQNIAVEMYFGKHHDVDSSEQAFKTAARNAFKQAFLSAKPVLLEPIVNVEITVPTGKMGDITGDLNSRRARIMGMETLAGNLSMVKAQVPLAEVMTYATQLRSMTQGQGSYTMDFSHYDTVPAHVQQQVVEKAKREKEEEEE